MAPDRIIFALQSLRAAASGQGLGQYDHRLALMDANITERGDDLTPLAMAWCSGLPPECQTIGHYMDRATPTGLDMMQVYDRALAAYQQEAQEE